MDRLTGDPIDTCETERGVAVQPIRLFLSGSGGEARRVGGASGPRAGPP